MNDGPWRIHVVNEFSHVSRSTELQEQTLF